MQNTCSFFITYTSGSQPFQHQELVEDNCGRQFFLPAWGGVAVVVTGWVKYITLVVHFISIIITSVLPQIINYQVPEAGDSWPTQLKKNHTLMQNTEVIKKLYVLQIILFHYCSVLKDAF